jgi:hypothetical protein
LKLEGFLIIGFCNSIMNFRKYFKNWLLNHPWLNPYGFTKQRLYGNITSPIRILPDFLIAGFNRSGTHSLFEYMNQHPNIKNANRREIHYFTLSYWRGLNWYKSYFPTKIYKKQFENKSKSKLLTGEATPHYIFHPLAIKRIKQVIPNVKLIIILRNPIDNVYSHYQYYKIRGVEKNSFEEVIKEDKQRFEILEHLYNFDQVKEHSFKKVKMPYVSYATYVNYIKRLLEIFPRKQILFIKNTDLNENPQIVLKNIFDFLEIRQYKVKDLKKRNIGKYEKMKSETRHELSEYFKPYNKELEELLEMTFDWK